MQNVALRTGTNEVFVLVKPGDQLRVRVGGKTYKLSVDESGKLFDAAERPLPQVSGMEIAGVPL